MAMMAAGTPIALQAQGNGVTIVVNDGSFSILVTTNSTLSSRTIARPIATIMRYWVCWRKFIG